MDEVKDQINWDSYLIPNTNVLKNKLGIIEKNELKKREREITKRNLAKIYLVPVQGNFDLKHLLEIHREIFGDIYPFAGEIRTCSMRKQTIFCDVENIENYTNLILKGLNQEFYDDVKTINDFAFKLAKYYHYLIYAHPFREGNGRTIRVFIRDFVVEKSKNLSCGPLDVDYTKMDKEMLLLGTINRECYPSLIEYEFTKGLVKVDKEKNKKI